MVISQHDRHDQYTAHDVLAAGSTLEPLKCLHCEDETGLVTFIQSIGDAHCGNCGRWQIEEE